MSFVFFLFLNGDDGKQLCWDNDNNNSSSSSWTVMMAASACRLPMSSFIFFSFFCEWMNEWMCAQLNWIVAVLECTSKCDFVFLFNAWIWCAICDVSWLLFEPQPELLLFFQWTHFFCFFVATKFAMQTTKQKDVQKKNSLTDWPKKFSYKKTKNSSKSKRKKIG